MKATGGFTLLELLIAVTLLALLSVLLLGGLHFGSRVWDHIGRDAGQDTDLRTTSGFLQRTLESAYPELDRSDPTHPVITFRGDASSLHYLAPMPQALGGAGFGTVDIALYDNGGDTQLVAHMRPELAFADAAASHASVLVNHIKAVEFQYFGASRSGETPAWQDEWSDTLRLPSLIRVRIVFPDGDHLQWPDLIVAPEIDVDALCDYDALANGCRGR
jgi:general secretion pathway protein J